MNVRLTKTEEKVFPLLFMNRPYGTLKKHAKELGMTYGCLRAIMMKARRKMDYEREKNILVKKMKKELNSLDSEIRKEIIKGFVKIT